jgi:hypothetical protein
MVDKSSPAPAADRSAAHDFKEICGIGKETEKRLHETGILTYDQLGALPVADLYALVKDVGIPNLTPEKLAEQDWPGQARKLAARTASGEPAGNPSSSGNDQHYASFKVELLLQEDNRVRRTCVEHIQSGAEGSWAGWNESKLNGFMVEHSKLEPAAPAAAPARAPVAAAAQSRSTLEVMTATTRQASSANPSSVLPSGEDWIIHVEWKLSDAQADLLSGDWSITAHLESIGPGQEYSLPADGPMMVPLSGYTEADPATGTYQYVANVRVDVGAVSAGRYRFVTVVQPADQAGRLGEMAGFFEGPVLYLYG